MRATERLIQLLETANTMAVNNDDGRRGPVPGRAVPGSGTGQNVRVASCPLRQLVLEDEVERLTRSASFGFALGRTSPARRASERLER
jgi:hypothetical protein